MDIFFLIVVFSVGADYFINVRRGDPSYVRQGLTYMRRRLAVLNTTRLSASSNIPKLIKKLEKGSSDRNVMQGMVDALVQIGEPAVAALIPALQNPGTGGYFAAKALGTIGTPQAIDALTKMLNDGEADINTRRMAAIGVMDNLSGEEALELFVAVSQGLDYRNERVFKVETDHKILEYAEKRFDHKWLLSLLGSNKEGECHRACAAYVLGKLEKGHFDSYTVEALVTGLNDGSETVRKQCQAALKGLGNPQKKDPYLIIKCWLDAHLYKSCIYSEYQHTVSGDYDQRDQGEHKYEGVLSRDNGVYLLRGGPKITIKPKHIDKDKMSVKQDANEISWEGWATWRTTTYCYKVTLDETL